MIGLQMRELSSPPPSAADSSATPMTGPLPLPHPVVKSDHLKLTFSSFGRMSHDAVSHSISGLLGITSSYWCWHLGHLSLCPIWHSPRLVGNGMIICRKMGWVWVCFPFRGLWGWTSIKGPNKNTRWKWKHKRLWIYLQSTLQEIEAHLNRPRTGKKYFK